MLHARVHGALSPGGVSCSFHSDFIVAGCWPTLTTLRGLRDGEVGLSVCAQALPQDQVGAVSQCSSLPSVEVVQCGLREVSVTAAGASADPTSPTSPALQVSRYLSSVWPADG